MESHKYFNESTEEMMRKFQLDEALLSRPLSELSLDELKMVREILSRRMKDSDNLSESLGQLSKVQPEHQLPEDVIQGIYDGQDKLEKQQQDYPADLEIVKGLIHKKESSQQFDWSNLEDGEIKDKLKDLVREIHLASTQMSMMTKEDVSKEIVDHIKSKGFSGSVVVTVSEPNKAKQRMIMGMATSPNTGEMINF